MTAAPAPSPPVPPRADLVALREHLARMADLARGMAEDGADAFLRSDRDLRRSVMDRDVLLDRFDLEVEAQAVRAAAVLQPEGPDLRTIEATIRIANCVDRVGRLGYDCCRSLPTAPAPEDPALDRAFGELKERAVAMFRAATVAFLASDSAGAEQVLAMDEAVDHLHEEIQARLIAGLRSGDPGAERRALALLVNRHLERVADNAGKIAEKTVYAVTGKRRDEFIVRRPPGPRIGGGNASAASPVAAKGTGDASPEEHGERPDEVEDAERPVQDQPPGEPRQKEPGPGDAGRHDA